MALSASYLFNTNMNWILLILALSPLMALANNNWPGLPPDCWIESRNVHVIASYERQRKDRIIIRTVQKAMPDGGITSPNKGYRFIVDPKQRPTINITIYSEKKHLVEIVVSDVHGFSDAKWVNEKIIFFRIWWGRIAASDIMFDVERERVVYEEDVTDAYIARQQYLGNCPEHGCKCIKRR